MIGLTGGLTTASLRFGIPQSAAQVSPITPSTRTDIASQQNAQYALATLKDAASHNGAKDAAKVAARQKLAQLKDQLNNLMMFGGDPKNWAAEAARIAKEIGETAKDYAQLGGDPATATSAGTMSQEAASSPVQTDVDSDATDAVAVSVVQTPSAGTADDSAAPHDEAQTTGVMPTLVAATPAKLTSEAALQASPSDQTAATASRSADQEFITGARLLARRANAILQSAIQSADRKKEKTGAIGAEGDKALTAIDKAAFALGFSRSIGSDISVAYGASAQSIAVSLTPTVTATA